MNKTYKSVWNAALGTWVAVCEKARGRGKGSARLTGTTILRALGLAVAAHSAPMAQAGYYTVDTAPELAAAILLANTDGDDFTSITLSQNITVSIGAVFDAVTHPVTLYLDMSTFSLRFQGVQAAVVGTGSYTYFEIGGTPGSLSLAVADGATLQTAGNMFFASGGLDIRGSGSALSVESDFVLGRGGDVAVTLADGAKVVTGRSFMGELRGSTLADNITVTVDGAGTVWEARDFLAVGGANGSVDVAVTNGGTLQVSGTSGVAAIGRGGTGTVLVSGEGSRLVLGAAGILQIGADFAGTPADGTLSVRDDGLVVAPSVQMAVGNSATTGTLLVDTGGTLETAALSRPVGTASVSFDDGTLRASAASTAAAPLISGFAAGSFTLGAGGMRLDSNGFDVTAASTLAGPGGLTKQGAGTLTLSASNAYGGATTVSQGRLLAGVANAFSAASAHTVATGSVLDTAGLNQTVPLLSRPATVSLLGNAAGSTLRSTGNYVGRNGLLRIGTVLGGSDSISDRLVLDGAGVSASGTTTVQVTALGGLGALTIGDGIEVVSALNGATTTAQTTKDAFRLANEHIDAGAYEYRLYAADANGAGENWYLRSTVLVPVVPPPPPPAPPLVAVPTYRFEVPLFAALPEQFRESNLALLANLHQRVGDDPMRGDGDNGGGARQHHAWGRLISTERAIRQGGEANPHSEGRLEGFQAGTDLWVDNHWRAGLYVGQLQGDMRVDGFASGVANQYVGSSDLRSENVGIYGTFLGDNGFYADAVLQAGRHRYDLRPVDRGAVGDGRGHSQVASIEVGQSWQLASGWRVEPQLQLVYQTLDLRDVAITNALVQQDSHSGWMLRAGVRLKGEMRTDAGGLQPYARFNLYRRSSGSDITRFIGPGGTADIRTRTGGTSSELAAGATLTLGPSVALYGELGKLWAPGGGARTSSGISGSLGIQVHW